MSHSRVSLAVAALAVAGALAFAAACKSSTSSNACGSGSPPSLVGTYSLVSYSLGGTQQTGTTGSLVLNANPNTYVANIVFPPPIGAQHDSGNYVIQGASCISENSALGNPQFIGTFELVGTTLTLSGTVATQPVVIVLTKTS